VEAPASKVQAQPKAEKQSVPNADNVPALKINMDDDIEVEEIVHDHDKMTSMTVIENEINLMSTLIKKASGHDKDFF
jgi:hypothetical protein